MAINITKVINEINSRLLDSGYSSVELTQLLAASSRIENSGINALTYRSTGHLPSTSDSDRIGAIAYVAVDDVFGDSSGRFYYASTRDSGWIAITTLQDSDEATIPDPAAGGGSSVGQNLQGTTSGYAVGGYTSTQVNTIDKYSYASNQNATDVGDMVVAHSVTEMTSSPTHTYLHAGYAAPGNMATLEKFPLTSDGNSALVPGVTTPTERGSSTHNGPGFGYQIYNSKIHKINHTSDTFSADAGSIPSPVETSPVSKVQSYTNTTHAYSGNYSPAPTDPFVKTAFASDTASASSAQADQTYGDQAVAACFNSDVAGYAAGGNTTAASNAITAITKFVFASEAEMTSVGTMSFAPAGQRDYGGTASTTHGYAAGGRSYTAPNSVATTENTIHNTPFASDAPSSDVGDLTQARSFLHHVQAQV